MSIPKIDITRGAAYAVEDCPGSAELTQELITNYLHHDDDPDGIVAAARGGQ